MINPEVLTHLPEISGILGLLTIAMAFTQRQREAIKERDGWTCQATAKHKCNAQYGLEVDHIIPQRYAHEMGIDPDFPENALSKCKNAHNIKHPDRVSALQHYRDDKAQGINTFAELGKQRAELLSQRQIYWNPANDRTDTVRALQLTQKAKSKGWIFPPHNRRET
jgi:hypothetical protein